MAEPGPYDPDELVRWAEMYGHPETWAKKAQDLHAKLERLQDKCCGNQCSRCKRKP